MTTQTHALTKRNVVLGIVAIVCSLAALMWVLAGCAPQTASESQTSEQQNGESTNDGASALDGQPANWTMESDCAICHTAEAESASDAACTQGVAHEAEGITCTQCHTDEETLSTTHADVKFGDKTATKPSVITVDPQTCISCHGDLATVATLTADSTALTDDRGTTVNPHERPAGEKHDENPATCTDCHNNHSTSLEKDAQKYCAQCHHRGVYECGTCHELRDR